MYEVQRLDNGIPVVCDTALALESFTVCAAVPMSSRDERPTEIGISHLLEHLIMAVPAGEGDEASLCQWVDRVGGQANASTTREILAFWVRVPPQAAAEAVRRLAHCLTRPAITDELCETERRVVVQELLSAAADPLDCAESLFCSAVFRDHPLGYPVGGDAEALPTFTAEQVVDRHLRGVAATPTCVALVGAAGALPGALAALRTSELSTVERRGDPPSRRPPVFAPDANGDVTLATPPGTEYAYLVAGGHGVSRDDELWAAFEVLSAAVGGTPGSILYATLRDALGLTYQLHSISTNFSDGGLWHVVAGSTPDELPEVEAVIRRCLEVVADGRLPAANLRAAVTQSLGSVLIDNEDPVARAHLDAFYGANRLLDEAPVARARREIARVGMADVARAARRVLRTYTAVAAA